MRFLLIALLIASTAANGVAADPGLRFRVSIDPKLVPAKAQSGRVLVGIAKVVRKPDFTDYKPPLLPILGTDAQDVTANRTVELDAASEQIPPNGLKSLPPGEYAVQAIFMTNTEINLPDAPGNLFCEPINMKLDPASTAIIRLNLNRVRKDDVPKDTATHKYLKVPSRLLSEFHGRPVSYRVGVVLPPNFASEPDQRYALLVDIGGFGTRYTDAAKLDPDPRFIQIVPDGAGPLGDPYQVNSANNGPYGDALTQEVIPFIDKTYRGIGTPKSRFTCGISTGGWVSFALQVFYPDFFNGCWSQAPDSVTFERFELIDLYSDSNAFVNRFGNERPSTRTADGDVISTVRHEVQLERVLGRGGRWELSGRDWASWNAVYGPRGSDGRPVPVWNGRTGVIDKAVAEHWKKYDLKLILERNWKTLGPKLVGGKINIWVGESDDYFLNVAVHKLKESAAKWKDPPFDGRILIELHKTHDYGGWTRKSMLDAMAKRAGF
jgi:hypothetical protein